MEKDIFNCILHSYSKILKSLEEIKECLESLQPKSRVEQQPTPTSQKSSQRHIKEKKSMNDITNKNTGRSVIGMGVDSKRKSGNAVERLFEDSFMFEIERENNDNQ